MVDISELESSIIEILEDEAERIDELSQKEIEETAKEALQLERNHPNIPVQTGAYKKSFALKKTSKKGEVYYTLYNKGEEYRKAHLLEYGHAKRNGGRTRAFPHWQDAQKLVDELPERIKRRIVSGT